MNADQYRKHVEGEFEPPDPPRLLVADIQISAKGETRVTLYQQLAEFTCHAGSLPEAVSFVVQKGREFKVPSVTIVQPMPVDRMAIDALRHYGLRVNGR